MTPVDRRSPIPLWAQIYQDLRDQLSKGEVVEVGKRFPTEHELTTAYGVSRQTVRQALARLASDGVLIRERGRGTTLAVPEFEQPLNALYSLARSVRSKGLTDHSEVRSQGIVEDDAAAKALNVDVTSDLVYLERLRFAGDEPLALDRSWLPVELARKLLDEDLSSGSIYDILALRCKLRVTGGWERIRPLNPSSVERDLLRLSKSEAVFAIERLARAGKIPVEWRISLVRGDRYAFLTEWDDVGSQLASQKS